jgi:hypothetical protein
MGGRGAKSITASGGVASTPAFSVTYEDGTVYTFANNPSGVVTMRKSDGVTSGGMPVKAAMTYEQLYDSAVSRGLMVRTYTNAEVDAANAEYRRVKEHNFRERAYGELHPNEGKTGIPARRLLTPKSAYRKVNW